MKSRALAIAAVLAAGIAGCTQGDADQTQIQRLQARVDQLSKQVAALRESAGAAGIEAESRCASQAKKTFELLGYSFSDADKGSIDFFMSHFDPARGKCFMLITQTNLKPPSTTRTLLDANTQIGYGLLLEVKQSMLTCVLYPEGDLQMGSPRGTNCTSEDQFAKFVAGYLGTAAK